MLNKRDGSIDVEKIHKRILDSDFIEISKEDYLNLVEINGWKNITRRTKELIVPGANVIFRMNIDVDSLI